MGTILDVSRFLDASTVCEPHHNASCEAGLGIQDDGGEQLDVVDMRLPCIDDHHPWTLQVCSGQLPTRP
jgi:hypothetical protein